ncbi:glycosyltransferase involved in cell wall biosynthesis [Motilibacter rhizosphaerae]|uniref:Glycosyltransferase involved in cell wall biosynthesis n=1 Tax=Motilibacter rhizosphaerae TaxID=598652 RepID=A0A4Q7NX04_9ACTN|nr:glycosyltransferase [Motilibacter rhizosphaerae]RZS91448.1 glycosyltransferase involved in cell wall biosynthesis [Motilibacter rhizosphaerae]
MVLPVEPPPAPSALLVAQRSPATTYGGVDLRCRTTVAGLHAARLGITLFCPDPADRTTPPPPGCGLRLGPPAAQPVPALGWLAAPDGLPADRWWHEGVLAELASVVAELRPSVAVLEHLVMQRALPVLRAAGVPTVLSAHNVEGRLHDDMAAARGDALPPGLSARVAERTRAVEGTVVAQVDAVWACSERDAALLRETYAGCAPVTVVPNAVDVPEVPAGDEGRDLDEVLYAGALGYPPNVAAAEVLLEALPALRAAAPALHLTVLGSGPPPALRARAAATPGALLTGTVPDAAPYLARAGVLAVPLQVGSGTRFKVLEAFAAGLPVVSTPKGVEGLDVVDGEHVLLADSARELVEAVLRLRADAGLREALRAQAHALVGERYSTSAVAPLVAASVAEVLERRARA